jgi:uncharacterized protein (DUF433 family)
VTRGFDIYGGRDPVELPAYSIAEAARLIRVPQATVRSWVLGRRYPTVGDRRKLFAPVILIADSTGRSLSFRNLVELHVLSAIRRHHGVRLGAARKAVEYLQRVYQSNHPLADIEMQTDGKNLFAGRYGELVDASAQGQMTMEECLGVYLDRIERDAQGAAIRLYPFTTSGEESGRRSVVIDPRLQFGRPCLAGTGMPTAVITERHQAGDSIRDIAHDYGLAADAIEEAIRYESLAA